MTDVARHRPRRAGREAAVFERIEAFRRRRPRLLDEVVTLAHGAGGKASAALLDALFLPAFANDALAAQTDAAVLTLPSGERWPSAPTRSWSSRCGFRADRPDISPCTAPSTTSP